MAGKHGSVYAQAGKWQLDNFGAGCVDNTQPNVHWSGCPSSDPCTVPSTMSCCSIEGELICPPGTTGSFCFNYICVD